MIVAAVESSEGQRLGNGNQLDIMTHYTGTAKTEGGIIV